MFTVYNPNIFFVNISTFLTHIQFGSEEYYNYDLREPKRKIINPDKIRGTAKAVVSTNDWSKIPYYPTTKEKRENVAKYLLSMGKQVPDSLIRQINEDIKKEHDTDAFNNFNNIESPTPPAPPQIRGMYQPHQQQLRQQQQQQQQHQRQQQQHQQHQQPHHFRGPPQPPNKFSQQYASYLGVKPRAQASARVGLGGVY